MDRRESIDSLVYSPSADQRRRLSSLSSPRATSRASKKSYTSTSSIGNDEDDNVTTCGFGSWRPAWLQVFAHPFYFMLNMALIGVIQGMTPTLFFSAISTFEKRFSFDSKVSGIILVADNFAELMLNPLIGYFGVRYNRARMIAIGEVILAFSCIITASPYFFYGAHDYGNNQSGDILMTGNLTSSKSVDGGFETCFVDQEDQEDCSNGKGATVWPAVYLLIFGSFARGLGYTCYFVIGLPYLDDNVSKKKSPIYISIMQSVRLTGPAFGYMLASYCLQFYENPFIEPGFGRKDPRFIGAWWLSFCITGILLLIAALPMFLFPAQLRQAPVRRTEMKKKFVRSGGGLAAVKRIVTNPLIMFYIFGNIFRYNGIGGYIMFKAKYIESQYRQSSSAASFLTGFSSFLPMAIGIMTGGSLIALLKPSPRILFIGVFIVEGASIFAYGSGLLLGCHSIQISGSANEFNKFSPQTACSESCNCSMRIYAPVCGPDKKTTYFSPCFAGCSTYNSLNSTFENCACLPPESVASKGYCRTDMDQDCTQNLYKFITILTVGSIISSSARTPNSLIALRAVDPMDKGFAIGLGSTLMDIFAFIPYPLLFGYIADKACLIWESKCGKTGNCWVYDHHKFRHYLHGLALFFLILGSLFDFLMIFFADRVKNFYDEDESDTNQEDNEDDDDQRKKKSLLESQNQSTDMNNITHQLIGHTSHPSTIFEVNTNDVDEEKL